MFFLICEVVFLTGSVVKYLPANSGDAGNARLIPRLVRPSGGRNSNPLQYYCQKKSHRPSILEVYSPWGHKKWTQLSD